MVFPPAVDADNSYSNGSVEARPRGAPLQYRKRQGRACRGFCGVYNEFSSIDFFHNGFPPIRALTQSEIDAQVPASCHFDAAMLDLFTLQCKSSSILLSRLSQKPGTPFEDLRTRVWAFQLRKSWLPSRIRLFILHRGEHGATPSLSSVVSVVKERQQLSRKEYFCSATRGCALSAIL